MVSATGVRSKLEAKVFGKIGQNITIENWSSQTTSKWGDSTPTYASGTSVVAVPYNHIKDQLSWEPFGDIQDGEVAVVVPYDTTVASKDRITYDSDTWYVKEIENFVMGNGTSGLVVAIGLLLAREIN